MTILLVEPFYSGSHKQFADQLQKHSRHHVLLLTLPGKFWKWRMYGAAVTLGQQFIEASLCPDLILATDMLDLPVFLSTVRRHLSPSVPIITYFHENQMAYPWQADSADKKLKRDLHYGIMNYQTALASDRVLFNSKYNMESFYSELSSLLKKMPDYKHTLYLEALERKSSVMPLGLELNQCLRSNKASIDETRPLILWNHRWEHDKNPEAFFNALLEAQKSGAKFRLAILGERYKKVPEIFNQVPELFHQALVHYGFASCDDYLTLLNQADLLPVTSSHDFFGISVMEAIHCGASPLLPKRLAYIELYDPIANPNLFYDNDHDLIEKITHFCLNFKPSPRNQHQKMTNPYDWSAMIEHYDHFFDEVVDQGLKAF